MSDYKFKVGDTVKVLKTDEYSIEGMELNIGKTGIILNRDNRKGNNCYEIDLGNDYFTWYYVEDSLELVSEDKLTFNKTNVLDIIYTELHKDVSTEICNVLWHIVNNIEKLKCK